LDKFVVGHKHYVQYLECGDYHLISGRFDNYQAIFWSIVVLLGDSFVLIDIKTVVDILHNYHLDKLVVGNKHSVQYLECGDLLSSHFWEV
jgi:hypothetical protein